MAALLVAALALAVGPAVASSARADETTIGYSPQRTSWDADEPGLTSDAVTQPDFGQLWSTTLGGTTASAPNQIYAQPLVADGMVIVATEENQITALDPKTGKIVWTKDLGPAWTPTPVCGDLTPHIGTTSTPVYDPVSKTIYLVDKEAAAAGSAVMKMYALSVTTGTARPGWPLTIGGKATNGGQTFNPTTAGQRAGLLLVDGAVYFATASHCDHGPYVGYVGRVPVGSTATPVTTPTVSLWSTESGSAGDEAGIWQSGGGPMSDGDDAAGRPRIFVVTGNGVSPVPSPGSSPPKTLGESVVRLGVSASGVMSAQDYFSPVNNDKLDQDDADLGSGGAVALPDSFGSTTGADPHPHLLVTAGKDGTVWLLDRDDLGGSGQGPDDGDAAVSSTMMKGVWGRAAVFDGGTPADHLIYLLPSNSPLQALRVTPDSHGVPTLVTAGSSSESFGYTSGSPVVTSDGSDPDSALVWVTVCSDATGANGALEAFPAVPPTTGPWQPVVTYPLGTIAKFIQPATDGGRVFVGTRDGRVLAFGSPTTAALTAPPTDFGTVPSDQTPPASVTKTITITATAAVTANSIATGTSAFVAGAPTPALGTPLAAGDTMTVPVTFTPTAAGPARSTLTVDATPSGAAAASYTFSISGIGTAPGIAAAPGSLSFGQVAVGSGAHLAVTIQNTGTSATELDDIDLENPTGPGASAGSGFAFVGDTPSDYTLPPQGSVTVTVGFAPKVTGSAGITLLATTDDDHSVAVPITGVGFKGAPVLTVSASTIAFGNVAPGATATRTLTVTNTGTSAMTINKAAQPSAPFTVASPISEGQTVEPGDDLTVSITVAPTSGEPLSNAYSITANDGSGPHVVTLTANTKAWTGPIAGPLGCVTLKSLIVAAGTPMVDDECSGSGAQRYSFGAAQSIRFVIGGVSWCLDLARASVRSGTAVQLNHCTGKVTQRWSADASGRLVAVRANLCLDVAGGSAQPDTPLVIDACGTSPTQQWDPAPLLAARGQLSSGVGTVGQYCLGAGSGTVPGTPAIIGACAAAPAQIVAHLANTLRIQGSCLTLAQSVAKAAVLLQPCGNSTRQVWQAGKGGTLVNPASKLCLDDPAGSTRSGTRLWVFKCNGTLPQRWALPG